MSSTDSTSGVNPSTPTNGVAATNNAGGAINLPSGVTSSSTVGTLADLEAMAPKVYQQLMLSVASTMITDMKKSQERVKAMRKQYDRL